MLINDDCLNALSNLETGSVDLVLADPPYGITACKWDSVIPLDLMWEQLNRVIKHKRAIALFGIEPFSTHLRMSNVKNYKYDWYWCKHHKTGHLNAKKRPMKKVETISVFYQRQCVYNPQGLIEVNKIMKNSNSHCSRNRFNTGSTVSGGLKSNPYTQKFTNYPSDVLEFKSMNANTVHPTQKPVDLMEYLIRTYSNPGDTVLDFTMGSGTTGVAAFRTGRKFIGIELNPEYFQIAKERIYGETGDNIF